MRHYCALSRSMMWQFCLFVLFHNVFIMFLFMSFGELLLKNLLENYIAVIVLRLVGQGNQGNKDA